MSEDTIEIHKARERRLSKSVGALGKAYLKMPEVLKKLGYDGLRPGQDKIIMSAMAGKDTIGILPTATGKTLCYILPTLCSDTRTLVFSPLVSLMKDQVEGLQRHGLAAALWNSSQTTAENNMSRAAWEAGELQFLLVAPERLEKNDFQVLMRKTKPHMVVIDEAHCVSSWAHSFRPAYARIADFVDAINPDVVLALTATATDHVLNDIREILGMQQATQFIHMPRRKNLLLSSIDLPDGQGDLVAKEINRELLQLIKEVGGPTIVYSGSRKGCEEMHTKLNGLIPGGSAVYHAEIEPGEKDAVQERFMANKIQVIFATNAFGLGINKPDIRGVIHRHPPGSIEALTQEVGRAGRDGKDSFCTLMNDPAGIRMSHYNVDGNFPPEQIIRAVYLFLKDRSRDAKTGLVDPDKVLALTGDEIGEQMGLEPRARRGVAAALGTLARFKVVDRSEPPVKLSRIQILGTPADEDFKKLCDRTRRYGRESVDGYFEIPLETLVQECGKTQATIQKWIKEMVTAKVVNYVPPFRGKTTRLVGSIDLVDFEDLAMRREHALGCIDDVQDYAHTPDELKHSYLERYFGITQ